MADRGHVARAARLGLPANRTLVRAVVALMLRDPSAPIYVHYHRRHKRVYATSIKPAYGSSWRQVGPHDAGSITLLELAREIEYLAQACRQAG